MQESVTFSKALAMQHIVRSSYKKLLTLYIISAGAETAAHGVET
jgi:hypothetical protein